MPALTQSKKTFNLRKIVKKLRKLDGNLRELWTQLQRKIEENLKDGEIELQNNLKDGESELQNNLKSEFN